MTTRGVLQILFYKKNKKSTFELQNYTRSLYVYLIIEVSSQIYISSCIWSPTHITHAVSSPKANRREFQLKPYTPYYTHQSRQLQTDFAFKNRPTLSDIVL